jgi:hypothetical protein
MRAMRTENFNGYQELKLVDLPKPAVVAKSFPLTEAADALRYLVEGRPFGRVVLTI